MPTFDVKCIKRCWDSKRRRRYYPGDMDKIDPTEPVAMYFEGFPAGTEVYTKVRGTKVAPASDGTKVIPGKIEIEEPAALAVAEGPIPNGDGTFTCDICGAGGWATPMACAAHRRHCEKKAALVATEIETPAALAVPAGTEG